MQDACNVLIIDDDSEVTDIVSSWCVEAGMGCRTAHDARTALTEIERQEPDVVLLDMYMPGASGLDLMQDLRSRCAGSAVVFFSASSDVSLVVDAMRAGAVDYVVKPPRREELLQTLRAAAHAVDTLPAATTRAFHGMVGATPAMEAVFGQIERVARTDVTVLVHGESGTGKELVARALHAISDRADQSFVAVNCASIAPGLEDAELFGHTRGSFTGATRDRDGWFVQANRGTLFLDEIADLSPTAQAKLLRVLQEGMIQPVGASRASRVDVRVVTATHKDLRAAVAAEAFRADLLYRLATFEITLPPLRDRTEDIPALASEAVQRAAVRLRRPELRLDTGVAERLATMKWPGNVRELFSAVQRAAILADDGVIRTQHFEWVPHSHPSAVAAPVARPPSLEQTEARAVRDALDAADGNLSHAARTLGISRSTLYRKLRRHE